MGDQVSARSRYRSRRDGEGAVLRDASLVRRSAGVDGRRTATLRSNPKLIPWLTVQGNIERGLRFSAVPRTRWNGRVRELLEIVRMPGQARMRPYELSEAMRQRTALARTLAQDVEVLLLDDPFVGLDTIARETLQWEVQRIADEQHVEVISVVHEDPRPLRAWFSEEPLRR